MKRTDATALARLRVLDLIGEEISHAVRELYSQVASTPDAGFHFPTGPDAARRVGYPDADLARVPSTAVARFAGVGCPIGVADLQPGERVLDLGCGGGTDLLLAADRVGPDGHVVGVDLTPDMVAHTRAVVDESKVTNVTLHEGRAPRIAPPHAPFDAVISNGVINLIPEKDATLRRLHELLKPGGRLAVADVVLERPPSVACLRVASLWAECLVGAFTEEDYTRALEETGFTDVTVHARHDYFRNSPSAETRETATDLGATSWVVTARRA